jgi:hypothetical protein
MESAEIYDNLVRPYSLLSNSFVWLIKMLRIVWLNTPLLLGEHNLDEYNIFISTNVDLDEIFQPYDISQLNFKDTEPRKSKTSTLKGNLTAILVRFLQQPTMKLPLLDREIDSDLSDLDREIDSDLSDLDREIDSDLSDLDREFSRWRSKWKRKQPQKFIVVNCHDIPNFYKELSYKVVSFNSYFYRYCFLDLYCKFGLTSIEVQDRIIIDFHSGMLLNISYVLRSYIVKYMTTIFYDFFYFFDNNYFFFPSLKYELDYSKYLVMINYFYTKFFFLWYRFQKVWNSISFKKNEFCKLPDAKDLPLNTNFFKPLILYQPVPWITFSTPQITLFFKLSFGSQITLIQNLILKMYPVIENDTSNIFPFSNPLFINIWLWLVDNHKNIQPLWSDFHSNLFLLEKLVKTSSKNSLILASKDMIKVVKKRKIILWLFWLLSYKDKISIWQKINIDQVEFWPSDVVHPQKLQSSLFTVKRKWGRPRKVELSYFESEITKAITQPTTITMNLEWGFLTYILDLYDTKTITLLVFSILFYNYSKAKNIPPIVPTDLDIDLDIEENF